MLNVRLYWNVFINCIYELDQFNQKPKIEITYAMNVLKKALRNIWQLVLLSLPIHARCIGYYTVDCTIQKYIWTSAQITTILAEEVNCIQLYDNYRPITTVQYRRILDGHVVGIMRCDWPFTVGYIIKHCIGV